MNILKKIITPAALVSVMAIVLPSCSDSKSYAELLSDENKAVNLYLSNFRVEMDIPADTVFETGPDAPFYKLDEEGNVYMQVLREGDRKTQKVEEDQLIYFRYTRFSLTYYYNYGEMRGEGNSTDMGYSSTSFRFGNTSLSSSTQFGSGIQMPLYYLGIDCEVNLIVKSQLGFYNEIASVNPYLFNLRYFKAMSN